MSDLMQVLQWRMIAMIVILTITQLLMPRLTRRDIWFAVTTDPSFRDTAEARAIERRYRWLVLLSAVLALGTAAAASFVTHWLLVASVFVFLVGAVLAFLGARRQVLPHAVRPTGVREAALTKRDEPLPGGLLARLGPFILLALAALVLILRWPQLPERIPKHWNAHGVADRWGSRSIATVFGPLSAGAATCLLLEIMARLIQRVRRIRVTGAAGAGEHRFLRTTLGIVLGAEYLVAITYGLITIPLVGGPVWPLDLTLLLPIAFIAVIMFVLLRMGQGGSRLAVNGPAVGDRTRDRDWKLGLIYVNPDDPAIFVEKRFGIGYTLNFGHKGAWLLLAMLIVIPVGLRLAIKLLAH